MKRAKEKEAQEAAGVATADRRRLTLALELVPGLKGVWLERQPLLLHPMRRELGEELRSAVDCRAERQLAVQAALRALEERLTRQLSTGLGSGGGGMQRQQRRPWQRRWQRQRQRQRQWRRRQRGRKMRLQRSSEGGSTVWLFALLPPL